MFFECESESPELELSVRDEILNEGGIVLRQVPESGIRFDVEV